MSMSFGRFLVEKNLLSKEQYIQAVNLQVESTPSALTSLIESNICSTDEVLDIIEKSYQCKKDIIQITQEMKGNIDSIIEFQKSNTRTLADILIKDFSVSGTDLEKAFNDYSTTSKVEAEPVVEQAEVSDEPAISAAALESLREINGGDIDMSEFENIQTDSSESPNITQESSNEKKEEEEGLVNSAALESLKEMGGVAESELSVLEKMTATNIDNSSDDDYTSIFTDKKNKKINKILTMIKESADTESEVSNYFNSLYKELHTVKGAAALVGAKYSKKLIEIWEMIIDKIFSMDNSELIAWVHNYHGVLKESSDILWQIREEISKGGEEENYMKSESSREIYLNTLGKLKNIISEMV